MSPEMFYLIGPPGVGKTAVMDQLLRRTVRHPVTRPFAHTMLPRLDGGYAIELGTVRPGGFSGTDSLAMNVQPQVERWLPESGYQLVLGEGDRLGNIKFLTAVLALGWTVHLAALSAPAEILAARRRGRDSHQNPAWMAGRQTKVNNIVAWGRRQEGWAGELNVFELDATRPPAATADALRFLVPALQLLEAPTHTEGDR